MSWHLYKKDTWLENAKGKLQIIGQNIIYFSTNICVKLCCFADLCVVYNLYNVLPEINKSFYGTSIANIGAFQTVY